jgi:hypothetical protein
MHIGQIKTKIESGTREVEQPYVKDYRCVFYTTLWRWTVRNVRCAWCTSHHSMAQTRELAGVGEKGGYGTGD